MCGLVYEAGAFFTFALVIITGYLGIMLFFRTVACMCPDFDSAIKIASMLITFFVLTSGYLIQWEFEQVWLRWIFYINPLALGFSSMMMNEFSRIDLTCTGTSLIPYGPSYGDIMHQVCTLRGSRAASAKVTGTEYVKTAFQYDPVDLWRNWGIMIVLIAAFLTTNAVLGEYIKWGAGGKTVTFFRKENKERIQLNEDLQAKRDSRRKKEAKHGGADLKIESKAILTWEDLCYDVPVNSSQLRLLKSIFGYVKPGELTALMGASGTYASKKALLGLVSVPQDFY